MKHGNILALVLAGGEGSRLRPLTNNHAKPAIAVGGCYRLVDFVLSNLVNSGIESIYLLAQHKPDSLIWHIQDNWDMASAGLSGFVAVVQPRCERGECYTGSADAVRKNLALIERHAPAMVAVFSSSHIYRMDVRQMADFHCLNNADATVMAVRVPAGQASPFDIISAGGGGEIFDFQEQPEWPAVMPFDPECVYASTGNFLFNTEVLVEVMERALREAEMDFGRYVLRNLIRNHHVYAYDFAENFVPGVYPHEERAYWRDIGTLETYSAAHCDMAGEAPRFSLHNIHWPLLPARFSLPSWSNANHAYGLWGSGGNSARRLGDSAFMAGRDWPVAAHAMLTGNA